MKYNCRLRNLPYRLFVCCAFLLLLHGTTTSAQKKELFTPQHVAKIRTVTSAVVSADGKQIAYVLGVPRNLNKQEDGPSWAELHVVDTAGKSKTLIGGEVNVSSAAWTPDGKMISFLQKAKKDKEKALYVIPPSGGKAKKILEHGAGIQSYSWSHDGKQIAFLATEPTSKAKEKLEKKGFNQEIYEEDWQPVKVWIASADGKGKAKALDLPGSASELHWSPVDDRIAVALAPTSLIDDRYMFRKIRIVDTKSGQILQHLDIPGKMGELAWSPDGKHVALIAAVDKYDPREGRLWVASSQGIAWHDVLPNYPGHVTAIAWRDDNTIIYVGAEGVWTTVGSVQLLYDEEKSKPVVKKHTTIIPTKGPILHGLSLSQNGKSLAFTGDTLRHPQEVYYLGPKDKAPRRLTDSNPWLNNMRFAPQEVIHHKAKDGLELEGILVRPLGEKEGKRYPLVLTVHGGPESHVPNGWVTRYVYLGQVGAANGMAVFYPNYRGSTGRGVKFSMMGQADAAGKEFEDLIDAVNYLVKIGLVDKDRVGITGGSYGGYATAWGATYYSDRFAAGVMFVGISDVVSKMGTTDIPWEMYLVHHKKWLWEDWNYFVKASPIYYIKKAKTPLLIMHGKSDPRVHPSQSLELHRHLKIWGKAPVRLVFYPGEGHGNRRAASRLDYNLRLLRWMKHYLEGPGGSPPPKEVEYGLK